MKVVQKLFPFILLLLFVSIFFWQFFLKGLLPIPSDTLVGLYHPFRDLYAAAYPRGIPFKNFLITDPIRQQYPWRELAITLEKAGQLPLWNPYNFAGYPLLGNFQSAALYPLNILLFLLPFSIGWSVMVFLQPLLGGTFLYFYLRNLKLHPLASLLGSVSFIFSGFFISWLEWNTVVQTAIWLPLILLAKDKLLEKWSIRWGIVFLFSECAAVFAGHLQILFYALCISNAYLFVRIWQKSYSKQTKKFVLKGVTTYMPFLIVGITMFVITAMQWLPTLQLIQLSARDIDQSYLTTAGWFIPWQHLVQFLAPDFFGNPTTLNYWGTWNYGELVGYLGILPLLMAFYAMIFRHDKKTYFFGSLVILSLIFSLPTPFAFLPFQLHLPLLSSSQPTRLLFVTDFSLAILAALGLDWYMKKQKGIVVVIGGFLVIFALVWSTLFKGSQLFHLLPEEINTAKHNLILPTILISVTAVLLCLSTVFSKKRKIFFIFLYLTFAIFIFDVIRFGYKFTPFTSQTYLYPSTATMDFLKSHVANNRIMTTDSRLLPPNVSTYYRLQSVDGYDPLYLRSYAELIAALERGKPDISAPFGFNRIITPHTYSSRIVDLLGVKYILTLDDKKDSSLVKVLQEGETRVYENKRVLPRAFFVSTVTHAASKQEAIAFIFDKNHALMDTAVVQEMIEQKQFSKGSAVIQSYTPNKVVITTQNGGDGFLVFTDMFYPTWHAVVDGKETKIHTTDYTFRGIKVSAGKHTVVFEDKLFYY